MGLFEDLGEKFEEMKQVAEASASQEATHGCRECNTPLYADHGECPECGSDSVAKLRRE